MDIGYRDFEKKDFAELREMMFSLYTEDPEGQALSDAKIKKTIDEIAAHPEKLRVVMLKDGEAHAGYAILVFYWSNEYGGNILNIDELYIKKEYRGKGLASGFFRYLAGAYKDIAALAVETTPSNEIALSLYGRLGFEVSPNKHLLLRND